jgi:hypothetical protein
MNDVNVLPRVKVLVYFILSIFGNVLGLANDLASVNVNCEWCQFSDFAFSSEIAEASMGYGMRLYAKRVSDGPSFLAPFIPNCALRVL